MKSLAEFTNQYQISKTLRFELKPVGKTAEWIKEHNIIGVEDNKLVGKDAERAINYKYMKMLLDDLHRLFIEEALVLDESSEDFNNLGSEIEKMYGLKEISSRDLPGKLLTEILDRKADEWIEQFKQEMPEFHRQDIVELTALMQQEPKKAQYYRNIIKKIEAKIKKKFGKTGMAAFYGSNEDPLKLLEWKVRTGAILPDLNEMGISDLEGCVNATIYTVKNIIRKFDGFTTYFSGFNDNRANVYDMSGDKSTSLIHRIFVQNMQFHFNNIHKWETIKKSIEKYSELLASKGCDWRSQLAECEAALDFFSETFLTPGAFVNYINQSGIDRYNEILGGRAASAGSKKIQGLNEFINLSRQQAGAKRHEFPPLQLLYKQILSKSDKNFITAFENDRDMLAEIKDFQARCLACYDNSSESAIFVLIKNITAELQEMRLDKDNIYISKDKLRRFSQELTGGWDTFEHRVLSELDEKVYNKSKYFSIHQIEQALNKELDGVNFAVECLKPEFKEFHDDIFLTYFGKKINQCYLALKDSWDNLDKSGVLDLEELDKSRENADDKGFEQIALIKSFLDSAMNLLGFIRNWQVKESLPENANKLWYEMLQHFTDHFPVIELYNKTRNHVTKKPYSTDKLKINFENSTLLDGWDRNKETDNYGMLFEKDGLYYLGVMTPGSNNLFDYEISMKDSAKKQEEKNKLRAAITATADDEQFRKINYKLLPGPNKMLPKVFFAASNKSLFNPPEKIIKIKEKKLYSKAGIESHGIENLHDYIGFCIDSLTIHPEWSQAFGFKTKSFKPCNAYNSVDEFYKEVEEKGYKITFDNIKASFIEEKINRGELYLFQIYSKDFSPYSKGRKNLHTLYWKALFEPENLADTVIKLNGQAEVFFRKASIELNDEKRKKGHHYDKLKDKFSYPIIKDRRYTENKFLFHCPISLNFKAPAIPGKFNDKVRDFLKDNPDVNIIGIDRGEKHLLYLVVINQAGEILHQVSLNEIATGYVPCGETQERRIDYHGKLDIKEKQRDAARKSWSAIENIKELKAGYLSQVVHELAKLIIEYNAIVVLEDLNTGFKRGRFKVEKQVYQKFEKALIDKLNYLVFKEEESRLKPGHYLNAYQLTDQFQSFEKIGKQSGILFYTAASYTSTTDPVTGFIKNLQIKYNSVAESVEFWKSFDSIVFNPERDCFEFTYTLGKLKTKKTEYEKDEDKLTRRQWTVCSCVERSRYVKPQMAEEQKQQLDREAVGKLGSHELYVVTGKLKRLFEECNIDFVKNPDIRPVLINRADRQDAGLHRQCFYYLNAIISMRATDSSKDNGSDANDFIMSPVEPFFDSRRSNKQLPQNGDANGAYNIARKGICILDKISQGENSLLITKRDWQEYAQKDSVVEKQISKLN